MYIPSAVCKQIIAEYSPSQKLLNALTRALYIELKCKPSTVQMVSFPQYTSCNTFNSKMVFDLIKELRFIGYILLQSRFLLNVYDELNVWFFERKKNSQKLKVWQKISKVKDTYWFIYLENSQCQKSRFYTKLLHGKKSFKSNKNQFEVITLKLDFVQIMKRQKCGKKM